MAVAALPTFRTKAFIDGQFKDAASGETFVTENPATGRPIATIASGGAADIDAAVAAARRAFDDGRWSRRAPAERKEVLLRFADLLEANLEELATPRLARGRQADHRHARGRRPGGRQDVPLVRRGDRQGLRRRRADRSGRPRPDRPRADRRGGRGRALELPAADGRPGRWRPALAAGNSLIIKPARLTSMSALRMAELAVRGRAAGRRPQRRAGAGTATRPGARAAHGRRHGDVHRLDRDRAPVPALLRGEQPQGGRARDGRQEPAGRARRSAGPGPRRRAGAPRRR